MSQTDQGLTPLHKSPNVPKGGILESLERLNRTVEDINDGHLRGLGSRADLEAEVARRLGPGVSIEDLTKAFRTIPKDGKTGL